MTYDKLIQYIKWIVFFGIALGAMYFIFKKMGVMG